ncbi:lipopolysaccharide assembly protein LapA domain-containing protein [Polynucleobacter kasalickyi]
MNSQDINLHWFVNQSVQVPLMIVILGAFLTGMIMSGLAFYRWNSRKSSK